MDAISEVREYNADLARALKKHSGIRKVVEDLYPDRAHFIFELLQNAEDTGATSANFKLYKTGLIFEHNGRPFERDDIYAITNIGESSKASDIDKIGRFGIGFKAVFAYSESPHIWSSSFSFKIIDLVLPYEIEEKQDLGEKTHFDFPFDNPKKPTVDAYEEVNFGLQALTETTLLFLTNLKSIRWENASGHSGEIRRFMHADGHCEIVRETTGQLSVSAHFLKFDMPVAELENKQQVAIAYSLSFIQTVQRFDSKKTLASQLKISPAAPGRVAVFFPAEKETSGLRFHLHAPFVPELSRASIKETVANLPLFKQISKLTVASLHSVRDLGLLTTDFLSTLPNPQDLIPIRYQGIRTAVIDAMNEQPLMPTYAKGHAPAKHLVQARLGLKGILSNDDLQFLLEHNRKPLQWCSSRALQGTHIDRFMGGLAIINWDIEQFVDLLAKHLHHWSRPPHLSFMKWLETKPLEWHQELYALLNSDYLQVLDGVNHAILNRLPIIRLSNGSYRAGNECYFPSENSEEDEVLPRVDLRTYTSGKRKGQQDSAKAFLEKVGVREVGEVEQVEAILELRYTKIKLNPQKSDLKRFISLVEKYPDKANIFSPYHIFLTHHERWCCPNRVFLDQPFEETGLGDYYELLDEEDKCFALSNAYLKREISIKKIVNFAKAVGVRTRLEITETLCQANKESKYLFGAGGQRWTSWKNQDYVIQGLDKLLRNPTLKISLLIWQTMRALPRYPDYLRATLRKNITAGARYASSQFIHSLTTTAWVAQSDGAFVRPAEARRDLLPAGFAFDAGWQWLKSIQFGEDVVKKSEEHQRKQANAVDLGFRDREQAVKWAEVDQLGISADEILAKYGKKELPDRESPNAERRGDRISIETQNTPTKKSVIKDRSVDPIYAEAQTIAKVYLKHQYTHSDAIMYCQLCQAPQPVVLDGVAHFEAVTCVRDIDAHLEQNNLALCPNHAAMYKNSKLTPQDVQDAILENLNQRITLDLAGNNVELYFTKQHLADLRSVLLTKKNDK